MEAELTGVTHRCHTRDVTSTAITWSNEQTERAYKAFFKNIGETYRESGEMFVADRALAADLEYRAATIMFDIAGDDDVRYDNVVAFIAKVDWLEIADRISDEFPYLLEPEPYPYPGPARRR